MDRHWPHGVFQQKMRWSRNLQFLCSLWQLRFFLNVNLSTFDTTSPALCCKVLRSFNSTLVRSKTAGLCIGVEAYFYGWCNANPDFGIWSEKMVQLKGLCLVLSGLYIPKLPTGLILHLGKYLQLLTHKLRPDCSWGETDPLPCLSFSSWAFTKTSRNSPMSYDNQCLRVCLRYCSFCLRGAYADSPYAIGLRKLTRLRVFLTQASCDTTASTHIKGGFGRCSIERH